MINGDKQDREVNKTLDLLGGIERLHASPALAENVMRRLAERGKTPAGMMSPGLRYAIVCLIALAALNVVTLLGAGTRAVSRSAVQTAAVDSLALEYGLTTKEYQYWE